jgi:hypothetical protein
MCIYAVRLGDSEFKPVGVTPEPEVRRHILKGDELATNL